MDANEVYEHLDHDGHLKDWYPAEKVDNPRFSHLASVWKAEQESPVLFANVIQGLTGGVSGSLSGSILEQRTAGL